MLPYKQIFKELNNAKIRYLIAGGFAVNFHGVNRYTADLDLIIHLESSNTLAFIEVMEKLGYVPRVPVNPKDFANESKRTEWIEEKNMLVFTFIRPDNPFEIIDIFVRVPKPFNEMDSRKKMISTDDIIVPVVGLQDLIDMKEIAGRDKDILDLKKLNDLSK